MRALQLFVITRFAFQVISCSAKDCLRNEHFRTKLVNITGLSKIWLYQSLPGMFKKSLCWEYGREKKFDSLPLIIERWKTLILIYFFDLKYGRKKSAQILLTYEFCILQLFTTEVIVTCSIELSGLALPFMEFQDPGFKMSKIFCIKKNQQAQRKISNFENWTRKP